MVRSIAGYTILAKRYGADGSYPDAEKREEEFKRQVEAYHAELAAKETHEPLKDTSVLTKITRAIWIVIDLLVPAVLAWRALFNSPDIYAYYVNRQLFYDVTIWCTLITSCSLGGTCSGRSQCSARTSRRLRQHVRNDAPQG
jgi:hypothetical protein